VYRCWKMISVTLQSTFSTLCILKIIDRLSQWLYRMIIWMFIWMIIIQCLLCIDKIRYWLCPIEQLEGVRYSTHIKQ